MKPRLLDLFCGAGGAGEGYARAGFEVVGVDCAPQPRYPYTFHRGDAVDFLERHGHEYDVIHASPPCQRYSKAVRTADRVKHPDLVGVVRTLLEQLGKPYIIENVPGAPLRDALLLCGSAFGLPIRRHRLFECSFFALSPGCAHGAYPAVYPPAHNRTNPTRVLSISGGMQKVPDGVTHGEWHRINLAAMGFERHLTSKELSESIPPVYTEYLGHQLLAVM